MLGKYNYNLMDWWECMVKPGIKEEAVMTTKELNKASNSKLNMLLI